MILLVLIILFLKDGLCFTPNNKSELQQGISNYNYSFPPGPPDNMENWDTSLIVDMEDLFEDMTTFNVNIDSWNVNSVTTMRSMFKGCTSFDRTLSSWNVSNVEKMDAMFQGATAFNNDISTWNVAKVNDMEAMFEGATSFNQDLSNWTVSSVLQMSEMFKDAAAFDQNLCSSVWTETFWVTLDDNYKTDAFTNSNGAVCTSAPTGEPSGQPSSVPSGEPSVRPSGEPSGQPSSVPSGEPSVRPSGEPTGEPSSMPSGEPSGQPSSVPSGEPSSVPSSQPSGQPSSMPSGEPSSVPSGQPSGQPSSMPSGEPSSMPSGEPSSEPSGQPSGQPSSMPSGEPSGQPSSMPSSEPSGQPSSIPSCIPSSQPSAKPSGQPSSLPSASPSSIPSSIPTVREPDILTLDVVQQIKSTGLTSSLFLTSAYATPFRRGVASLLDGVEFENLVIMTARDLSSDVTTFTGTSFPRAAAAGAEGVEVEYSIMATVDAVLDDEDASVADLEFFIEHELYRSVTNDDDDTGKSKFISAILREAELVGSSDDVIEVYDEAVVDKNIDITVTGVNTVAPTSQPTIEGCAAGEFASQSEPYTKQCKQCPFPSWTVKEDHHEKRSTCEHLYFNLSLFWQVFIGVSLSLLFLSGPLTSGAHKLVTFSLLGLQGVETLFTYAYMLDVVFYNVAIFLVASYALLVTALVFVYHLFVKRKAFASIFFHFPMDQVVTNTFWLHCGPDMVPMVTRDNASEFMFDLSWIAGEGMEPRLQMLLWPFYIIVQVASAVLKFMYWIVHLLVIWPVWLILGILLFQTKAIVVRAVWNFYFGLWTNSNVHRRKELVDVKFYNYAMVTHLIFWSIPQLCVQVWNNYEMETQEDAWHVICLMVTIFNVLVGTTHYFYWVVIKKSNIAVVPLPIFNAYISGGSSEQREGVAKEIIVENETELIDWCRIISPAQSSPEAVARTMRSLDPLNIRTGGLVEKPRVVETPLTPTLSPVLSFPRSQSNGSPASPPLENSIRSLPIAQQVRRQQIEVLQQEQFIESSGFKELSQEEQERAMRKHDRAVKRLENAEKRKKKEERAARKFEQEQMSPLPLPPLQLQQQQQQQQRKQPGMATDENFTNAEVHNRVVGLMRDLEENVADRLRTGASKGLELHQAITEQREEIDVTIRKLDETPMPHSAQDRKELFIQKEVIRQVRANLVEFESELTSKP